MVYASHVEFKLFTQMHTFRFGYLVEGVDLPGEPMRVEGVWIEGQDGKPYIIDVIGRRTTEPVDTRCVAKMFHRRGEWPDWLTEIVKDAKERAAWG